LFAWCVHLVIYRRMHVKSSNDEHQR
jgi:hypothetical protein